MSIRLAAFAALCLMVSGCATGPSLQQSQASIPELSPDRGRVYFYRTNSGFGAAIQPSVKLDGVVVGDSVPGGVFYCDVVPGPHIAGVTTEVDRTVNFSVAAGEPAYIKMDWGFGYLVYRVQIETVAPNIGAGEAAVSSLMKSQCPRA